MDASSQSRREFFAHSTRGLGGAALGGSLWAYLVREQAQATPFALRPPGALPEDDFLAKCIKCGQCVVDCPYHTLRLAELGAPVPIGTPHFEPRQTPCFMCPALPCVRACPTGALDPGLEDVDQSRMGIAVIVDRENCLSYRGLRCEICHRDCPLTGTAITVEPHPRMLSKHAVFVPVVLSDGCTGCGICEQSCPLPEATIKVLPPELARGALGEHYEFGWTSETEITQQFRAAARAPGDLSGDLESSLDYLNEAAP